MFTTVLLSAPLPASGGRRAGAACERAHWGKHGEREIRQKPERRLYRFRAMGMRQTTEMVMRRSHIFERRS